MSVEDQFTPKPLGEYSLKKWECSIVREPKERDSVMVFDEQMESISADPMM
ncbi:hypothetical protein [Ktedonobacter robiniae]|uniref:hypothetical protein n=1 Tax=Ktedonobacter robiniae TaxID=2778365 RepID=UPI001915D737|nr:hypothetical protein [Ktedonobacter robiniae]